MCRMTIYKGFGLDESILLSDLIVKPKHSIIHQSYNCQERFHNTGFPSQLNADGFGIGWYAERLFYEKKKIVSPVGSLYNNRKRMESPHNGFNNITRDKRYETPCVFTSISPAWNNRNLVQLADKVSSPLFFAHVRAASIGSPTSETNCHPFTFDKYLWMHNGGIGQFQLIRKKLLNTLTTYAFDMISGNTDSEHCFALFLTKLAEIGPLEREFTSTEMTNAMIHTIEAINVWCREAGVTGPSLLNFAVTDGETVVATRYVNVLSSDASSLYISSGARWIQSESRPDEYIMQREDKNEKVFIMASERLSMEVGDWLKVPKNSVVTVTSQMSVQIASILDHLG